MDLVNFWPRLPLLLALLGGVAACVVAYINRRRQTASCLGAIAFSLLFLANGLGIALPFLLRRRVAMAVLTILLLLLNTVAILILIVAVLVREKKEEAV